MRTKSLLATLLMAVLFAGCYKDDIDELQGNVDNITNRLETLEQWMNETNTNIASLQTIVTALEKKDYVTEVTPLADNTGYEINFSQSGKITIYNGKNGTDGYTPEISIEKDKDENYCWTLDGEFMTDADGKNISAMGQMPQLKIEADYWYISYDGKTWTKLGKAKGEDGEDGKDGANGWGGATGATGPKGDSFFEDVEVTEISVTFTLSEAKGGAEFTLPIGAISFEKAGIHTIDLTETTATLNVNIPESYQALTAKIEPKANDFAIMTKTGAETWKVGIAKGETSNKAVVTITIDATNTLDEALLTVTLVDSKGESYSIAKVIRISQLVMTADELITAANEANTKITENKSYNITLGADIDLTGKTWPRIGTSTSSAYTGIFDGQGYSITGLKIDNANSSLEGHGLIAYLGSNGVVKDVNLIDCDLSSNSEKLGGIVGVNNGLVDGCSIGGQSTIKSSQIVFGGIVGENSGTITNCIITGNALLESSNKGTVGGIVGRNYGVVNNCEAIVEESKTIQIKAASGAGGIAGYNSGNINDCKVINSTTNGIIQISISENTAGGIVGSSSNGSTTKCYVYGCKLYNEGTGAGQAIGGIIGNHNDGCKVIACIVEKSELNGKRWVGGIAGKGSGENAVIIACYTKNLTMSITDDSETLGGIVAINGGSNPGKTIACYNWGNQSIVGTNYEKGRSDKQSYYGSIIACHYNNSGTANATSVNATASTSKISDAELVDNSIKVSDITWTAAVTEMNAAIDTWNAANSNACAYKWKEGTTYATAELE